MATHWSVDPFRALHQSIESGSTDRRLLVELKNDLCNLTLVPKKNQQSRQLLEKGNIKLSGIEYELNQEFKEISATLSDELNIDEIIAAEFLQNSSGLGITSQDNARAAFYLRKQTILSIVSYIFNAGELSLTDLIWNGGFFKTLFDSFKEVHEELKSIHQTIQRAKLLEIDNLPEFKLKIAFRRDSLKDQHEGLSEIFHGLVSRNLIKVQHFKEVLGFIASFDVDDLFIVHLLPGLILFVSQLDLLDEGEVKALHSDLLKDLSKEDAYKTPIKVVVILIFLTYFISWCKKSTKRVNEFDFEIAIESPMILAVQLGAIEQLLIITSETSNNKFDLFYDTRSLLEQHLPRLVAKRILDVNEEETKRLKSADSHNTSTLYIITKEIKISENLTEFLTNTLHDFIQSFISDAAFLLIKIKDSEEDSLLSGEDFALDEISKRADLERFYLSIYYLYADREDLIATFWDDRESNAYGFIEWSSKCEDLLMRSTFILMLSGLSSGDQNANHVYHFITGTDQISWSSILEILNAYIDKISKLELKNEENDLNEETILTIASYLTIIYQTAKNSDTVKGYFDSGFLDCLFNLIKLDTPLIGPALHVISSLVSTDEQRKNTIWNYLDQWLFSQPANSFKECFQNRLTTFPDVLGFTDLLANLLQPLQKVGKYSLPYPQNLGAPHRKPGISPYLDFLLSDIFYHSPSLYFSEKVALQEPILKIIDTCLSSFDPKLILISFPAGVNLNTIVSTPDFASFVQANPAPIALNLLFQEKVYATLLDIASTGIDNISDKSFEEQQVQVVDLSLKVISKIFDLEVAYVDELLPILKKDNNFVMPGSLGTHGLSSFYDAISFHLPVVAHLSLYIGSSHLSIADKSIKLLSRFAKSSQFGLNSLNKSKLLTVVESVNESLRIKHNFIAQLSSEISDEKNLDIKIQILNFINSNLSFSSKKITVSHFLLGFDMKNGPALGVKDQETFIASKSSVFNTILYILESSYLSISSHDINYAPIRLASLSLEIILKLSRNSLTSEIILDYLSSLNLLDKLLQTPRIDSRTLWSDTKFNPDVENITSFNSGPAIGAFLSLLNQRSFILQYLSLELHRTSSEGSISKTSKYINSLINGSSTLVGPPKVLSLIDILEFNLNHVPTTPDNLKYFKGVDLNLDLNKIELSVDSHGPIFNLQDLDTLLDLHLKQLWVQGSYHTNEDQQAQNNKIAELKNELQKADSKLSLVKLPQSITSDEDSAFQERELIKGRFINYLSSMKFKTYQLSALHSWVQLIQVIVADGKLNAIERSDFILEVFQSIVPKITDYVEKDVLYAEELVSLCVSLYDIYHKDRSVIEQEQIDEIDSYERLYPLFKTCIQGILSPSSSLELRSDLYVLTNKYLSWVLKNKEVSKEILQSIKASSEKLISVVCNDAISGEGSTRITGLLLLESLYKLSSINQLNFISNILVKNNLLLLLVKSIKRTDETLMLSRDNKITLDSLLYELTAFKASLSFLIRVAETRNGAQQLLQSEIFQTIKACSFLLIDPDLGLDLVFDESTVQTSTFVRVNLNLDTPLSLDNDSKGVSLFELLVPIFQLVTAILLSTSSENTPVIQQVKNLLSHFEKLIVGVLKRDVLAESKKEGEIYNKNGANSSGLKELVNLFVLLSTLTKFKNDD
ncbi:hypothetical protein WICMUC_005935 [Wickerhamomyces mucosus]|uniref:Nucleoporin n=1 Tax=Wickerhamomyces mucosus TaxID=1378264 RepID=A0A9P8T2C0_9ASCO|nr:hypothetical protein WICMUC_005935 [Wickerhamomyces mucosus]